MYCKYKYSKNSRWRPQKSHPNSWWHKNMYRPTAINHGMHSEMIFCYFGWSHRMDKSISLNDARRDGGSICCLALWMLHHPVKFILCVWWLYCLHTDSYANHITAPFSLSSLTQTYAMTCGTSCGKNPEYVPNGPDLSFLQLSPLCSTKTILVVCWFWWKSELQKAVWNLSRCRISIKKLTATENGCSIRPTNNMQNPWLFSY